MTEVLGLPGSGKSTVERALAAWGGRPTVRDWDGPRPASRLPPTVELSLRAPVLSLAAYLAVATRRGARPVHLSRVRSVQRRHLAVRRLTRPGCVLDEGPVHALFVTLYGTRETAVSRPLLRLVLAILARRVDRYVYIDASRDSCVEHFRRPGRTSVRFNADSSPEVVEEFRRDQTYEEIRSGLLRVAPAKLSVVDSAASAVALLRGQAVPGSAGTGAGSPRRDSR